ncbi:MAG: DNA polymerase subunit beta [Denitrovibrio sp.]|nr:MAG: DNA polymerase subunit beta [Denitrovibrio sp.]
MRPVDKLIKCKNEVIALFEKYEASDVRIFGSVAVDLDTEDSDIDFLVRLKPNYECFHRINLKEDLEELLDNKVDVVTYYGIKKAELKEILENSLLLTAEMDIKAEILRFANEIVD